MGVFLYLCTFLSGLASRLLYLSHTHLAFPSSPYQVIRLQVPPALCLNLQARLLTALVYPPYIETPIVTSLASVHIHTAMSAHALQVMIFNSNMQSIPDPKRLKTQDKHMTELLAKNGGPCEKHKRQHKRVRNSPPLQCLVY